MKNHILINPLLLEQDQDQKKQTTDIFNFDTKTGDGDLEQEVESSGRIYGPENYPLIELTKMLAGAVKDRDKVLIKNINKELEERSKTAVGDVKKRLDNLYKDGMQKYDDIEDELKKMTSDKVLTFLKNKFKNRNDGSFFGKLNADEIKQYNEINDIGEFELFDDKMTFIIEKLLDKGGAVDEEGNVFERGGEDYNRIMNATEDNFAAVAREVQLKYSTPAVKPSGDTNTGDLIDALVWIYRSGEGIANTENMRDLALAASHAIGLIEKDDKGEYRYTGSKEEQEATQKTIDNIFDALNVVKLVKINQLAFKDSKQLKNNYRQYYRNLGKQASSLEQGSQELIGFKLSPKVGPVSGKNVLIAKKLIKTLGYFWLTGIWSVAPGAIYAAIGKWDYTKDKFWNSLDNINDEIEQVKGRIKALNKYLEGPDKRGRTRDVRKSKIPFRGDVASDLDLDEYDRTKDELREYIKRLGERKVELEGLKTSASRSAGMPDDGPKGSASPNWTKRTAKDAAKKTSMDPKDIEVLVDGKWVSYKDLDKAQEDMVRQRVKTDISPRAATNRKFVRLIQRLLPGFGKGGKGGGGTKALPPAKDLNEQQEEGFIGSAYKQLNKAFYDRAVAEIFGNIYFAAQLSDKLAANMQKDLENTVNFANKLLASADSEVKESKIKISKSKLVDLISDQVKEQTQTVDVTKEQLVALVAEEACKQINRKK